MLGGQGWMTIQYHNFFCPPSIPTGNPVRTNRRVFAVPSSWYNDDEWRLRFDGVDRAYHFWVNQKLVGYAQGSRNPAEFGASNYVNRANRNELVVRVYQWSDGPTSKVPPA
ncbi:galactose-binding domain-like protein [Cladorrhinum sp. PSN259]|nr:galactose-binding domain-like protein [Cladorrhinum sp. PSN259]